MRGAFQWAGSIFDGRRAGAVAEHRDAIRGGQREETTADRLLWVRLDVLPEAEPASHHPTAHQDTTPEASRDR